MEISKSNSEYTLKLNLMDVVELHSLTEALTCFVDMNRVDGPATILGMMKKSTIRQEEELNSLEIDRIFFFSQSVLELLNVTSHYRGLIVDILDGLDESLRQSGDIN
jgi:hypothetical protein